MSLTLFSGITILALSALLFLPALPSGSVLCSITLLSLLLLRSEMRVLRALAWLGGIFCWGVLVAQQQISQIDKLTRRPLAAEVRVIATEPLRQQISIKILTASGQPQFPALQARVTVGEEVTAFCAGQRWRMRLRLRPVHGRLNEGGYDQQRAALAGYRPLSGRILQKTALTTNCSLRANIMAAAGEKLTGLKYGGVLQALLFGVRDTVSPQISQLFRETGIAHLMAISGMHIGLAAASGWGVMRCLQRGLPARLITPFLPGIISLSLAACYTWLSGMQAPALRAMLAMTLWQIFRQQYFNFNSWQIWLLCAGILLFSDPMFVLSESFWLSTLAVLMLLVWYRWFALPRYYARHWRWRSLQLIHLQSGMLLLMLPLQALLFNGTSLVALPANLIAIPLISLFTLPVAGLALLLTPTGFSGLFWQLADKSLALLVMLLESPPPGWWYVTDVYLWGPVIWGGLLFFRSAACFHYPFHGLALLLCCLLWRYPPRNDEWRVDMLDVGHGLAVVISQGDEAVVYDTGNRWQQSNAGERIIVPWLLRRGLKLQQVIISHRHLDHYGGLTGILSYWPLTPVRTAFSRRGYLRCFRGERWQWQRLNFIVLWPPAGATNGQNNDSCVIKVSDGFFSLLLTGDLERQAEMKLVSLEKQHLQATFLQVPHHGSNTSSSPVLLRTVKGEVAMASVARYNAWKMPSLKVIERYRHAGFRWSDTAVAGQISLRIYQRQYQLSEMREEIFPRWYHQWFGVKPESR